MEWLIESGEVDSSERNHKGSSALLLASEGGHLSFVSWLLEKGMPEAVKKTINRKQCFRQPSPPMVLWANLYRDLSKSPDVVKSTSFDAIAAYQGTDVKLLRFTTLKLFARLNTQKLLASYRETIKAWWSMLSAEEQSALPTLKARLEPSVQPPTKPAVHSPAIPVVFQAQTAQVSPVQPSVSQIMGSHSTVFPGNPRPVGSTEEKRAVPATVLSYPEQVEKMSKAVQDKINPEELKALFKWVTEGHLLEVEQLLKKNPTLTLGTGTVKDLSDRTFKNITALQYAAWALDSEMCELIMPYAGAHNSAIQLKALSEEPQRYSPHGASYDFTPLVTKTKTYVDNCGTWDYEKCCQYWQKEVGGEQRKCPAWLIYAWSEEGYDVAWTKKDANRKIAREYDKHRLEWWFTENYNNGTGVGSAWATARGFERAECGVKVD